MTTPAASRFPNKNELKRFARSFVKERIDSLEKDVIHCLQPHYAPFPAILYCLSTIDLLGALNAGQAAKIQIQTGMWTLQQTQNNTCRNIWVIPMRHKLVHLAQHKPCISYNNKVVTWEYVHDYTPKHLIL
jgi:hypothetical protein